MSTTASNQETILLTEAERSHVINVARRLRSELAALVETFPPGARTSSGMSRTYGVNRTLCHRLLSALSSSKGDLDFLTLLPGVRGLRLCVSHTREGRSDATEASFAAAEAAIDSFDELVSKLAGSHARLAERIHASTTHGASSDTRQASRTKRVELRKQIYDSIAELVGRTTDVRANISLMRPMPDNPGRVEYVHVRAYSGHRARAGALSLVLETTVDQSGGAEADHDAPTFFALDGSPLGGRSRSAIIREFTGDPAPVVTTRDAAGRFHQVIDNRNQGSGSCPDVVLGYRIPDVIPHPANQSLPIYCEALGVKEPVRDLVMDVYLHHSMTAGCKPSMTAFLGNKTVGCDITDRWFDRIEGSPLLTLLGPGIHNAASTIFPPHAALTQHIFATLGWQPDDFVGYRCEEKYPQWGCDYVMAFDYRDTAVE